MRCLTLADELVRRGHECLFAIRRQPGDHSHVVLERGHELLLMPHVVEPGPEGSGSGLAHANWLMAGQSRDADDFVEVLKGRKPEWVVVDHYGIDRRWEERIRTCCSSVMVIDDLADRAHCCALLVDQNFGRVGDHYSGLVPGTATVLCGPEFALLRREFSEWRDYSLRQKRETNGRRLLINLGGVDQNNVTGRVLDALSQCPGMGAFELSVVMGSNAPCVREVESQIRQLGLRAELLTGISNMAEVMANSDLAIGAAGATSLERCCLGLPTVLLVIAENQQQGAVALSDRGAAICIPDLDAIPSQLCESLGRLSERRDTFTASSIALCDGEGTTRVANHLEEVSGD